MEGIVSSAATGLPIPNATVTIGHGAVGCGAGRVQDFGTIESSTNAAGVYRHHYDHPCQIPFREGSNPTRNCGDISFYASAPGFAQAPSPTRIRCVAGVQRIDFALSAGGL
jgi:hypothetical protein